MISEFAAVQPPAPAVAVPAPCLDVTGAGGNSETPDEIMCEAIGCHRPADWAFIGEGWGLSVCDFHGGSEPAAGWARITRPVVS